MRTCTFQTLVNSTTPLYEGSKMFKKEMCPPTRGVFLEWGSSGDGEGGTNSVALIEDQEGRVHEVYPSEVIFTDKNFGKIWKE